MHRASLLPCIALLLLLAGCTSPATPPADAPPAQSSTPPDTSPSVATTLAPAGPVTRIAVMGDSLSRGFNACAHVGDCPEASWAGGTDPRVDSLAERVGDAVGGPVSVRSVARSGSTAADLPRQAALAIDARPDLITLLSGANDVCRATVDEMTPTAEYVQHVSDALQRIAILSPGTVVLVASVPDVTALLPAAADDPTARFVWSRLGGCATVLADPLSTAPAAVARRQAVRDRIEEYDAALERLCTALPRCVTDGGALHGYRPRLDQLSALDSFHPSIAGLRELARLEWNALRASERSAPLLAR